MLALVAPFVFRAIIDTAIPQGDKRQIVILASIAVGAARRRRRAGDRPTVVQRPRRRRADLRPAPHAVRQGAADADRVLHPHADRFDHVAPQQRRDRRPDRGHEHARQRRQQRRRAASRRSAAMLALEWQLTLLTLVVLPIFVIPARRVGRRLQGISREQMAHNAAMNTQMTERFNVSGATLVKLFGSGGREQVGVRAARRRRPRHRRPFGALRAGVLRRPRPRRCARHGGGVRRRRDHGRRRRHLDRHARRAGRARHPGLPAADRPDERPRRPDDVDGQLRACVRGARRARGDPGTTRRDRPDRSGRCGRVRRRRVPLPAGERDGRAVDGAERRAHHRHRPRRRRAATVCR